MTGLSNIARRQAVLGGAIGLVVFGVDAIATLIRFTLNPMVAARATGDAFLAMLLFLLLFVAAGALAGYLWSVRIQFLRLVTVGALVGATVWSYMTVTWPLTGRASSIVAPQASALSAAGIGAAGGALGGFLLFVISLARRRIGGR